MKTKRKQKLLFLAKGSSPFVVTDRNILSDRYDLKEIYLFNRGKLEFIWFNVRLFFTCIFGISSYKGVFIWFADYHTLIPILIAKLFRRTSYLVIGGFETANIPEIKYGGLTKPLRKFCVLHSMRNASFLLPVHNSLLERYPGDILPKGSVIQLPTGWSEKSYYCCEEKLDQVLFVASIDNDQRKVIKGLDRLILLASYLPNIKFVTVGIKKSYVSHFEMPENIVVRDYVDDIRKVYGASKIVLSLSRSEGFQSVLCEGMLCECIPVSTDIGGARDIIGNTGWLIPNETDIYTLSAQVSLILREYSMEKGIKARNRIVANYSESIRQDVLLKIITNS